FSGIGLHTGHNVSVRILPAGEDTGITFVRTDIPGSPRIKATASSVVATDRATTIGCKGVNITTIEHILAAFYGLGVDNAVVEVSGPEIPALDGSAAHFIEVMEEAGLKELSGLRKYLVIKKPIKVTEGGRYIFIYPSEDTEFTVDYSMDFQHPFLTKQTFSRLFSVDVFKNEVGSARTFVFKRDVERLRANGLAKGGSLNNAVVIGEDEILNEGGLRFPDELVRHKVLDMVGDISLLGAPVVGRIIAHRAGHSLNFRLVQQILKSTNCYQMTDLPSKENINSPCWSFMKEAEAV
ncbi:MAG: UDP-3-O-acyl-N-acetylglucosamine deacetylase, partial [Deltaproteobacteria bacterium]|nr:UDP-3-O-acyl-N-acetylglucosamine deacetylase [Deltaproteobacteria bacterium]